MRSGALLAVDLRQGAPDKLGAELVAGDLDIGPISVVDYLHHADELLLLPDLAVGSDGPVRSVNLVATRPVAGLDGAAVALDPTSRTGVLLARLLLTDRYQLRPRFVPLPAGPGQDPLAGLPDRAAAGGLIGDRALRAHHEAPGRGLVVTDLGQGWGDWTGLPMVFAVWAARRPFVADHPGLV